MNDFIEVIDSENQCLVLVPVGRILSISYYDENSTFIEIFVGIDNKSIGVITKETYSEIKEKLNKLGKIL